MGAELMKVKELELDKVEAKKLGDAITEVTKHYAVVVDPKKLAIFNLCAVAGAIYGPRFYAAKIRKALTAPEERATPIDRVAKNTAPSRDAKPAPEPNRLYSPSDIFASEGAAL